MLIPPDPILTEAVNFEVDDTVGRQTGGYSPPQGLEIQRTGDPFADAVEGEYQMPIYRPTPAAGTMPFLSLRFSRPPTEGCQAPPPPQSSDFSTGSFGRLEFADAVANYERMYGPVEDYQPPSPDDPGEAPAGVPPVDGGSSPVPSGTRFYPVPPPVVPTGSGHGGGARTRALEELRQWEAQYGPAEDYYAAQQAADQERLNDYLGRQGEETVANRYGYSIEQLREINADRRRQGLPPLR